MKIIFHIHDESFFQHPNKLQTGGQHHHIFHSHAFFELMYSVGDNNKVLFDDETVNLEKYSYIVLKPGENHETEFVDEELFSVWFTIEKTVSKNTDKKYDSIKSVLFGSRDRETYFDEGLKELFFQLKSFCQFDGSMNDGCIISTLLMMFFNVVMMTEGSEMSKKSVAHEETGMRAETIQYYDKVDRRLNFEYMTDITPKTLSEELFISEKQINRYFLQRYNETMLSRRTRLRMASAKDLLNNTNLSITNISEMTGYHSINTFYSAFKKFYGCTPDVFRNGGENGKKN